MSSKFLQEIQITLDVKNPPRKFTTELHVCFPPEESLIFGFTSSIDFSKACFRGYVHFVAFLSQPMTRTSTGAAFWSLM